MWLGFLISFTSIASFAISKDCEVWFNNAGIKAGPNCLLDCTAPIAPNLKGAVCVNECPELCNAPLKDSPVFKLTKLYPGLTEQERLLAASNPSDVLKAYQLSWKAESICSDLYLSSEINDESDACRHFMWAALMTKTLGRPMAEKILDVHEQEPTQLPEEKAMDLANNRRGISKAEELINSKKFDEKAVLKSFGEELKKGNLVILRNSPGSLK